MSKIIAIIGLIIVIVVVTVIVTAIIISFEKAKEEMEKW